MSYHLINCHNIKSSVINQNNNISSLLTTNCSNTSIEYQQYFLLSTCASHTSFNSIFLSHMSQHSLQRRKYYRRYTIALKIYIYIYNQKILPWIYLPVLYVFSIGSSCWKHGRRRDTWISSFFNLCLFIVVVIHIHTYAPCVFNLASIHIFIYTYIWWWWWWWKKNKKRVKRKGRDRKEKSRGKYNAQVRNEQEPCQSLLSSLTSTYMYSLTYLSPVVGIMFK